jgi:hypothetical protein
MSSITATTASANDRIIEIATNSAKVVLIALCAMMLISVLHPDVRSQVRGTFVHDYRTIVSTVEGDLTGKGSHYKVAKVKTQDNMLLEIYELSANGSQKLVDRIVLADKRDGYFNFKNQASNLAIDDIDGDGRPEILVPSFDNNLVGHLNVYSFDPQTGTSQQKILR